MVGRHCREFPLLERKNLVEHFRGNPNENMKSKIFMSQNVPLFIKMKNFTAKSNITSTKKNHFYMKIPLAVGRNLCLKP